MCRACVLQGGMAFADSARYSALRHFMTPPEIVMRSLHIVLPSRIEFDLTPRHLLLLCAAVTLVCLLSLYVQAIHESMARGIQLQAERQTAASARRANAEGHGAKLGPVKAALAHDRYPSKATATQG